MLALRREREREARDPSKRKGLFTSGIETMQAGRQIARFFTGQRHMGENLATVPARRTSELGPLVLISGALTRNLPEPLK